MTIQVTYKVASTSWTCAKLLKELEQYRLLSFDTETEGIYSKEERKKAGKFLESEDLIPKKRREFGLIANNSGLSYPSLIKTTHFIFGISNSFSYVLVAFTAKEELMIWNWVKNFKGRLLIHNALFDLRIMYHRVKAFPKDYLDTSLLAKCLINNADNFKSRIGLKDLMGSYYDPAWSLFDSYEPEDLLEPKFIKYAATDGAATIHLGEDLGDYLGEENA